MAIPRIHLFELEDLPWFPALIRDCATDYLRFMQVGMGIHRPLVPLLKEALVRTDCRRIIDLCSGGAGPMVALERDLRAEGVALQVTLTDRFPNLEAFGRAHAESHGHVDHVRRTVDARSVPSELAGFRTIFNGFHHFTPPEAAAILRDAVARRQPIGVFDLPERTVRTVAATFLVPLAVWLTAPLVRPLRWSRLLFTYLIPVVPLTSFWDGIISNLRAYTPDELLRLVSEVDDESYDWQVGRVEVPGAPVRITYLIGTPNTKGAS